MLRSFVVIRMHAAVVSTDLYPNQEIRWLTVCSGVDRPTISRVDHQPLVQQPIPQPSRVAQPSESRVTFR